MDKSLLTIVAKGYDKGHGIDGHDFVDLCLPSGTLWATCNIGATAPLDYGNYFKWLTDIDWLPLSVIETKLTDDCLEISPGYDVATMTWGKFWRTPTMEQLEELAKHTICTDITCEDSLRGKFLVGKKLTSKQDANKFIILPFNGSYRYGRADNIGTSAYIWSRTSIKEDQYEFARMAKWSQNDPHVDLTGGYFSLRKAGIRPVIEGIR